MTTFGNFGMTELYEGVKLASIPSLQPLRLVNLVHPRGLAYHPVG